VTNSGFNPIWGIMLGLALLLSACAGPSGETPLPRLADKEPSQGLVPPEYLCPKGPQEAPDPMLAKEIGEFLEKSGILGGVPATVAGDLPVVLNAPVRTYLHAFANSKNFQASLSRSGRYLPMMRRIFKEHGLPQDLVWVALVESGFNPWARSPKEAVGMWQFIEDTARRYGLQVNEQVDERRDPEKSTRAAARYLQDLYKQFGCWYLAAAGYNAGEKRVEGVVNRHDTRDFWIMAQKKLLPQETCNYVPQIIAAALIAKNPGRYGLPDLKYQAPQPAAKVKVPGGLNWRWFAHSLEVPEKEFLEFNPQLQGESLPAGPKEYWLKVPGNKKREADRLARLSWRLEKMASLKNSD
jgi:membrane-bound lytic murein transglycosylase D